MAEEAQNGSSAGVVVVSGMSLQVSVPASKAEEAVAFYKAAFGAEEVSRTCCPKRKADQEQPSLLCAEVKISGTSFLICGNLDDSTAVNEAAASRLVLRVQVEDVDAAVNKAEKAGAVLVGNGGEEDTCCGGRLVKLADPFGLSWDVVSPPPAAVEAEA